MFFTGFTKSDIGFVVNFSPKKFCCVVLRSFLIDCLKLNLFLLFLGFSVNVLSSTQRSSIRLLNPQFLARFFETIDFFVLNGNEII